MKIPIEVKVRAVKLYLVDECDPEEILEDLEKTFGFKVAPSYWDRPLEFIRRMRQSLTNICARDNKQDPEKQRAAKLLEQAGLIDQDKDNEDDLESE